MAEQQATGLQDGPVSRPRLPLRRGFSLIDLLVSMAVVAVLILIMVPSLSSVRESARRVVCASNIRQIGLGLSMYSDDYGGTVPPSKFVPPASTQANSSQASFPQNMMIVRTMDGLDAWEGLGVLYAAGYLDAPGVFYCPSHHGDHHFSKYVPFWGGEEGMIVTNYHFRGDVGGRDGRDSVALVTDGLASRSDYNHKVGANVLRSDFTVSWFADVGGVVASLLPYSANDPMANLKVGNAWEQIDQSGRR